MYTVYAGILETPLFFWISLAFATINANIGPSRLLLFSAGWVVLIAHL